MTNSKIHHQLLNHLISHHEDNLIKLLQHKGPQNYLEFQNPFALLIGAIIGQKISFKKARSIRGKLYTMLGKRDFSQTDFSVLSPDQLSEIGIESYKVDIMVSLSNLDNDLLTDFDYLLSLKGIGPWTINNIKFLIRLNNGEPIKDIDLWSDLVIRRNSQKLWNIKSQKSLQEKLQSLQLNDEQYKYLLWFIWRSV